MSSETINSTDLGVLVFLGAKMMLAAKQCFRVPGPGQKLERLVPGA